MIVASLQYVVLASDTENLLKIIIPIIVTIFYVISAISKGRRSEDEEVEETEQPQPPVQRPRPQPQQRPVPQRTPAPPRPIPQQPQQRTAGMPPIQPRPLPQQIPQSPRPTRPQPQQPPRPAQPVRHPEEVFKRVTKPIPTNAPVSVEKLEHRLDEKARNAERQPAQVLQAERVVETALKPSVLPPAEVANVQEVEAVDIVEEVGLDLHDPQKLREAIILREILGPPLALR
jgi:hypothetical protein